VKRVEEIVDRQIGELVLSYGDLDAD